MILILNWTDFYVAWNMVIKKKNLEIIWMPYCYFLYLHVQPWPSVWPPLAVLVTACDDFNSIWSSSNCCISFRKVFYQLAFDPLQVGLRIVFFCIGVHLIKAAMKRLFCNLHPLARPFGHPSQDCVAKFTLPTSFDLFICILL